MFQRVNCDRPLRHLRIEIAGHPLPLVIGSFAGLAKKIDRFLAADRLAVATLGIVYTLVEVPHPDDKRTGVIDRYRPTREAHAGERLLLYARFPDCPGLRQVR